MTERTTVWAARLGTLEDGRRGTLELGPSSLVFVPDDRGSDIVVPLTDVRRVRRSPGSPVIVVERSASNVAYYFVEPPPLRFRSEVSRKVKGRAKSISYLRARNRTKREEVVQWVERIREAVRDART